MFRLTSLLLSIFISTTLLAAPQYRGFQIDLTITDDEISQLKNEYEVNVVRVLIGNDGLMDSVTGQDYIDMMEGIFDEFDPVLERLAAQNIKVVFALYSPPGGFQTRVSPSHYKMFATASLQQEYIDMWLRIMARYKDNANIYAFDLLNEPAMRKELLGSGVKTWNVLLKDTIKAIRAVAPTKLLMVKSLYGDPSKLTSLPAIKDSNIIFSYHPYIFLNYQQSGLYGRSTTTAAPSAAAIKSKLLGLLAKFYLKHYGRYLLKQVKTKFPVVNAGEIAVSAMAMDSGVFIGNLLDSIDNGAGTAAYNKALKKFKKKPKLFKTFTDFKPLVTHQSWTIHSFGEAEVWDPRFECASSDECSESDSDTTRATAIKAYTTKN